MNDSTIFRIVILSCLAVGVVAALWGADVAGVRPMLRKFGNIASMSLLAFALLFAVVRVIRLAWGP